MTDPQPRRKAQERRKHDAAAWMLGAGISKDRRSKGDRRASKDARPRK